MPEVRADLHSREKVIMQQYARMVRQGVESNRQANAMIKTLQAENRQLRAELEMLRANTCLVPSVQLVVQSAHGSPKTSPRASRDRSITQNMTQVFAANMTTASTLEEGSDDESSSDSEHDGFEQAPTIKTFLRGEGGGIVSQLVALGSAIHSDSGESDLCDTTDSSDSESDELDHEVHALVHDWTAASRLATGMPLFEPLNPEDRSAALEMLSVSEFKSGEAVITAGEIGHEMYIIASGTADAMIGDTVVKRYSGHEFFGELALITSAPRAADVVATSDLTCLVLARGCYHLLSDHGSCGRLLREALDIADMTDSEDSVLGSDTDSDSSSDEEHHAADREAMQLMTESTEVKSFLRNVTFLQPLSQDEIDTMAQVVTERHFLDGPLNPLPLRQGHK